VGLKDVFSVGASVSKSSKSGSDGKEKEGMERLRLIERSEYNILSPSSHHQSPTPSSPKSGSISALIGDSDGFDVGFALGSADGFDVGLILSSSVGA